MPSENVPIYLDWSFWTAVFAFVAIILSQIPPVRVLLKRANLELELFSKATLTHKLGNPNVQLYLMISNVGGRRVRVQSVTILLQRGGRNIGPMPAQNFLQHTNDSDANIFTPFSLLPGEEWAHSTNFLNFFDLENGREFSRIESGMKTEFATKKAERENSGQNQDGLIELSAELDAAAQQFHDGHFCWFSGEYQMEIKVHTDTPKANLTKRYRFTLFESQSDALEEIKHHYKYGGGFWWSPSTVRTTEVVDVQEN